MPLWKNWNKCCDEVIKYGRKIGLSVNPMVVRKWYITFWEKCMFVPSKLPKHYLPPFLQENQDVVLSLQQNCQENLSELSVRFVSEYIHDVILPKLAKEESGDQSNENNYKQAQNNLLKWCCLTKVCPSTIYQWMQHVGVQYLPRRKGYHMDGHERPATVENHNAFTEWYLKYEQWMFQWIQLPKFEAMKLEKENKVPISSGYQYEDKWWLNTM